MIIKKIILTTIFFGITTSSITAMENLEKYIGKDDVYIKIYSGKSGIRYQDSSYMLINGPLLKLPPCLQKYRLFGPKATIEKAIATGDFVDCRKHPYYDNALIYNTKDLHKCSYIKEYWKIREILEQIPDREKEFYDNHPIYSRYTND